MGTRHKEVTATYVDIDAPSDSTFFIQNKGSNRVELFIGDSAPSSSDEGLVLYPEHIGVTVTLAASELCYAKTEDVNNVSTVLVVE